MTHRFTGRDRLKWTCRAAVVVWLAWLASYALTAYQLFARVTHPHFLPLISLMLLGCTAGIVAMASGLWRIIRGPSRLTAMGWLVLRHHPHPALDGPWLVCLVHPNDRESALGLPAETRRCGRRGGRRRPDSAARSEPPGRRAYRHDLRRLCRS